MDPQPPTPPTPPSPENPPSPPAVDPNVQHLKINPLSAMRDGETVVTEIRRHPFGIILTYIFSLIGFAAACGVVFLLLPKLMTNTLTKDVNSIILVVCGALLVCMILVLAIATMIYWQNRWVVTSDSITQITQRGLFNRQSSQLSFGSLEDITTEQNGLLAHIFGFGTLKVETAGEHSKFYFLYCPNPDFYARQILVARETFLENEIGGQGQRRLNRL